MNSKSVTSSDLNGFKDWRSKVTEAEWLGHTLASLCWVVSVFVYGLSSIGDYLQLFAALFWLFANIASLKN